METCISKKRNIDKIPNWQEADQLVADACHAYLLDFQENNSDARYRNV